ncbi:MAG: ABC transporter substrate-binding protein [Hyphomicrobiales bacterium]|nr:ABC transporter substrate-binding protein [Hyphomicrobiales bacterium]
MKIAEGVVAFTLAAGLMSAPAFAQKKYDQGASDTEILIGNTAPYSGPASAYSVYGSVFEGYFKRLNERGGINGRKIKMVSYDDAYSPPKTVEQTRRLVESDGVLLMFGVVGTPPNVAIMKYMNGKKIPQLFGGTGTSAMADPEHFPWSIGFQPSYRAEGRLYADYILAKKPDAKIGVLYQDDDFGKDLLQGLTTGLGDKAKTMIVATTSYDTRTPSVDSQIVQLKGSGADVLMDFTTPKFSTQAIRKTAEIGWKPLQFVASVGSHVGSVLKPAGFDNSKGVITGHWVKDPNDPANANDPGVKEWREFMNAYYPNGDQTNNINVISYVLAQTLEQVLRACGDDLTREHIMKVATTMPAFKPGMLIEGVRIQPSPADYLVVRDMRLEQFDGASYQPLGSPVEMRK